MANDNGRNKWIMYLVGLLVTIVVLIALPTMASQIWTNDRNNTHQHIEIKATMIERDEKLMEKITTFSVEQMRQGTILERIEGKL